MRVGLLEIINATHVTVDWLFECNGNYWTFGDAGSFGGNIYESKIITETFSGVSEHRCNPADNLIPPNETRFSIAGEKTDFSAPSFIRKDLTIRMLIDGVEKVAWGFYVKSCYYSYGRFNFSCEDFLQKYMFNSEFPNTELLSGFNSTSAKFSGSDKACIPEVFGTPYAPLRPIPYDDEWLYVLGMAGTYSIEKAASPVDFDFSSEYLTPEHMFTQSEINGLQVFANDLGAGGVNSPFISAKKICDLPTQFSKSDTALMTSPADIISSVLQKLGLPVGLIDTTGTFAASKSLMGTQGVSFDIAFTTREEAIKVLCKLLLSCNCILLRTDKVLLIPLEDDVAVKTLTRDHIKDFSFSPKIYNDEYDAGYVQYYTGIQAGDPEEIPIAINGVDYSNISSEKLLLPYMSDSQIIQKLAIIHYRRKYLQTGSVSFQSNFSLLDLQPGDRLIISDDLYEDYQNVYVDSINIKPDLSLSITCSVYSEVIGDLTDYSPAVVTHATDNSPGIVPLADRWLKPVYTRSATLPETPAGDSPAGWSATIPTGADLLYESVAWFGNNNKLLAGEVWSVPIQKEGLQGVPGLQGVQGEDGDQGIQGVAGTNGNTSYFHVKYADDETGTNMNESGGDYIGTYVDFTAADSAIPGTYNWVLTKGVQGVAGEHGIPGENGSNGQTSYLHIKYSDNGTTFTGNTGEDVGDYIGTYVDFVQADSTVFSAYSWKKIAGAPGATGDTGPGLTYTGEWSNTSQYYATSVKRDVVKSDNNFYACKGTHVNIAVTNTTYWEAVPAFQSIATGILLADDATILRSLVIGTSTDNAHLENCAIRSGMTSPDNGTGFYIGRHGGKAVASFISDDGAGFKIKADGTTEFLGITGDNTKTAIDGGIVTTGSIRDADENLVIDFSTATMIIKKESGLLIDSNAGMTVNGDININSQGKLNVGFGGEINCDGSINMYSGHLTLMADGSGQTSELILGTGSNITARIGSEPFTNIGMYIMPEYTANQYLSIGTSSKKWKDISLVASSTLQILGGTSLTITGTTINQTGTTVNLTGSSALNLNTSGTTTITAATSIHQTVGATTVSIKNGGIFVFKGLRTLTTHGFGNAADAVLLPSTGDSYLYKIGEVTYRRYRRAGGTFYSVVF